MSKTVPSLFAVASLLAGVPAVAGEMRAEEARQFVADKLFSFTCFEGTSGEGRVHADGSVGGVVRFGGSGPPRYATLPPGTLRVRGEAICAMISALPFEVCFDLDRTDEKSFRGSLAGLTPGRPVGPEWPARHCHSPSSRLSRPQVGSVPGEMRRRTDAGWRIGPRGGLYRPSDHRPDNLRLSDIRRAYATDGGNLAFVR